MASRVAWLSFDAEQQRRTQLMMAAFASQGTIDELGLGGIRDLIAGVLNPGMTVLHNRAKYLLFLPRIYGSVKGHRVDQLMLEGRRAEARLARDLVEFYRKAPPGTNANGIVGRDRGEETKQLASQNYWPLMRRLGIARTQTVGDYCRQLAEARSLAAGRQVLRSDEDVDDEAPLLWSEVPAGESAPTSFDLSYEEAEWLRERFLQAEASRQDKSLTYWVMERRTDWVAGVARPWDHPMATDFPGRAAEAMYLGWDLDRLAHGARILYNHMCATQLPKDVEERDELVDRYERAMDRWTKEVRRGLRGEERLKELHEWALRTLADAEASLASMQRWQLAYEFLRRWRAIADGSKAVLRDASAQQLIRHREALLKPGRARLSNPELLRTWSGRSGFGRFDYNWGITQRLSADIHAALGTPVVEVA